VIHLLSLQGVAPSAAVGLVRLMMVFQRDHALKKEKRRLPYRARFREEAMAKKQPSIPANLQPWVDARRKFHLSHAHVQMARELGMNPKKLGKLDNHRQKPWKLPLPEFITQLYAKRFRKDRPDTVRTIEEMAAANAAKKQAKKTAKDLKRKTPDEADDAVGVGSHTR
jgi:hypothetical protein